MRWCQALIAAVITAAALAQPSARPVSIDDVLSTRYVPPYDPVLLSPNGRWATYTVADPSRVGTSHVEHTAFTSTGVQILARGCTVWTIDLRTGKARNVSGDVGSSWGASWSPDGHYLAFYSDRDGAARLWMWETGTNHVRRVSPAIVHPTYQGFEVPRWLPDAKHIVVKLLPAHMSLPAAIRLANTGEAPDRDDVKQDTITARVYTSTPGTDSSRFPGDSIEAGWTGAYRGALAVVDIATGKTRNLVPDVATDGYWVSPSGRWLAYTIALGSIASSQQNLFNLAIVPMSGGRPTILATHIAQLYGIAVSWSPDEQAIAYTNSGVDYQAAALAPRGDCFVVGLHGAAPRNLTPNTHPAFGDTFRPPLWSSDGASIFLLGADTLWRLAVAKAGLEAIASVPARTLSDIVGAPASGVIWSPDGGHSVFVRIRDTTSLRVGLARVDVRDRSTQIVLEEDAWYGYEHFATDAAGTQVVYVSQTRTHGDELSVFDAGTLRHRQLTHLNPQFDGATLGPTQLVQWRDTTRHSLRGVLMLPPPTLRTHAPYPLVVFVYGGALRSRDLNEFGGGGGVDNMQLFASRGYAVLLPDAPIADAPMRDIATAVLPGISSLVALGIADSMRIGVMGESYGGYSVLSLVVQSNRFRAAVSASAPADLIGMWGQMAPSGSAVGVAWAEEGQGGMNGSPWQRRDRYIENSPLFYLDRVTTPLLLMHGAADPVVPAFLGDQIFVALRRLHKSVVYVKYAGEGHTAFTFSRPNARDYLARVLAWFDSHLRDASSGDQRALHSPGR